MTEDVWDSVEAMEGEPLLEEVTEDVWDSVEDRDELVEREGVLEED